MEVNIVIEGEYPDHMRATFEELERAGQVDGLTASDVIDAVESAVNLLSIEVHIQPSLDA